MINFSKKDGFFHLETNLLINEDIETVFNFFETPKNLNLITPSWLNFKIKPPIPNNTYENQEIEYKLSLHKIRFTWRSRIIAYKKNVYFCDFIYLCMVFHCFLERPTGGESHRRVAQCALEGQVECKNVHWQSWLDTAKAS